MSHFNVLVIGADHEAALQPFHEFECTGHNDQYVQDIDITVEARSNFEAETSTRLKAPDGTLHSFFDEAGEWRPEFSQLDPNRARWDQNRRTHFVPEGYEKVEVPTSQFETFEEWVEGYYGIKLVDDAHPLDLEGEHKFGYVDGRTGKVIDRTNPNKKWDWWVEGGRWPDKLLFKNGSRGNSGLVGDLDLDGMLAEQAKKAANVFDSITSAIAGREVHSWASVLKRREAGEFTVESAREFYNGQKVVKDLIEGEIIDRWYGAEQLSGVLAANDRAQYIERESQINSSTWALLHEGNWSERGSMGWFGMSDATEGSTLDYAANFWLTLRNLPADTRVTVVDCHI